MGTGRERRRPGYAPGGRRDAILDAALDEFAAGGYNGTSLAKVAERAGLTQQGLLHYFPSKQALLVALLNRRDEMDAAAAGDGRVNLVEVVRRNVERRGIVQVYTVLSAESVTEGHPAQEFFHDRFDRLRVRLEKWLRDEHGDRLPSGVAPGDAASLLIAAMDGLQTQWLHDPEAVDMPRLVQVLADTLAARASDAD
ncbi:TetR family transcriptional regulator [Nocardiopsis sp. RSe5-2]|uniref:TetR family transcriptional regulator n=1 Tax=Nocardiopsis endophytica TaxID=3018445 RepID=A0ABT4UAQ5_9ACTN|nr:TetR family transcriptional regulator [Nocardiopsis endophytica]MDA2813417.1 TetR family transcriptional regulator [Nocardiopsis endophytica]